MQPPVRFAPLLVTSLVLALLAVALLGGAAWGVNVGLWAVAVALASALVAKNGASHSTRALGGAAVAFALLFGLRDSNALKIANVLAIAFCVGAILLPKAVEGLGDSPLGKLLATPFAGIVYLLAGAYKLFMGARDERTARPDSNRRGRAVLRGFLIALPLLLVFGGLFTSADVVFRTDVESLGRFEVDFGTLWGRAWTFFFALVFVGGLLHRLVFQNEAPAAGHERSAGRIGIIEVGIVLGSLVALFGAFLAVQFRYLFGAQDVVRASRGLSYAEYARGGFFELVLVAALSLVVLIGADGLLHREKTADETAFRGLGRILVAMVALVVASALMRMRLYTDAFGLTELRVYSTVFMFWLVLAFGWLLATTLNGRPQRLAFGLLVSGLGVIFATNLVDPDALIVRTNLSKPNADFAYLATLGDDAALALRDSRESIPAKHRSEAERLIRKRAAADRGDWRESNLARWRVGREPSWYPARN